MNEYPWDQTCWHTGRAALSADRQSTQPSLPTVFGARTAMDSLANCRSAIVVSLRMRIVVAGGLKDFLPTDIQFRDAGKVCSLRRVHDELLEVVCEPRVRIRPRPRVAGTPRSRRDRCGATTRAFTAAGPSSPTLTIMAVGLRWVDGSYLLFVEPRLIGNLDVVSFRVADVCREVVGTPFGPKARFLD